MILDHLEKKGLISPPSFLMSNTQYLAITGSVAYGVADTSVRSKPPDNDVCGFCLPPKDYLFKNLRGEIDGFGTPGPNFDKPYMKHHIMDKDAHGGKGQEWDLTVYNIVQYFELSRKGNPNMIDTLFVPEECLIHCTRIGRMVRDNRKLFVSKAVWPRFRGYAFEHMKKMQFRKIEAEGLLIAIEELETKYDIDCKTTLAQIEQEMEERKSNFGTHPILRKVPDADLLEYHRLYKLGMEQSKRFEIWKFHKFDTKFAYHIYRLLDEVEQLLENGEMNLQRAKEAMKSIRRGDWKPQDIVDWAMQKSNELDLAFTNCKLPNKAPEDELKRLLLQCLEEHYGSLSNVVQQPNWAIEALSEMDVLIGKYREKMYENRRTKPWWKFW